MKKKISINLRKSEKLFRNLIKDLRKKTADEAAESETVIKSDQKETEWSRDELYTISYETQVQRQKINETAITIKKVE